jgi:flap endonuclease-1
MGCDLAGLSFASDISFEHLANRTIAVDAYNTLYQFLTSIRQPDGTPLMDSKGRLTGHLSGLFYRSLKWVQAGITPIFVFDGKPPLLKQRTLDERMQRKMQAQIKLQTALSEGDEQSARKYAQQTTRLTPEMAESAKQLLQYLGIACVQAPCEGEAQASYLVQQNLAYACASQDFDSLLFGASRLVRNMSTTGRRKVPRKNQYVTIEPQMIELSQVLKSNNINHYQLIWIAMLSGTDFNCGVHGIGPKKALKLVVNATSFDQVISRLKQMPQFSKTDSDEITGLENWQTVEQFFLNPPIDATTSIQKPKPDEQKAISFLVDEFEFSADRIERTLHAHFEQQKKSGGQTRLGDF